MNKEVHWSDIVEQLRRECDAECDYDDECNEWLWMEEDA